MSSPTPRLAVLMTQDPMIEDTVRQAARSAGHRLMLLEHHADAVALAVDKHESDGFAIVDLDTGADGRQMLETIGGALPVLAITERVQPWLESMQRRRRVGATLVKPFTPEKFHDAWNEVRRLRSQAGRAWR